MPERSILVRRLAGVAASHGEVQGHDSLVGLAYILNLLWIVVECQLPVVSVSTFQFYRCNPQSRVLPATAQQRHLITM
jgi:hypothetical protein